VRVSDLLAEAEAQFPSLGPRQIFEIVAVRTGYQPKVENQADGGSCAEELTKALKRSVTEGAQTKVIPNPS